MTERERLIELLKKSDNKLSEYIRENDTMDYIPTRDELFGVSADYLLEIGVLVPPCKVGDRVYVVYKGGEYYWQCEVLAVWIRCDKVETDITVTVKFKDKTIDTLHIEEIYLTKEEAEQALKGGGKE